MCSTIAKASRYAASTSANRPGAPEQVAVVAQLRRKEGFAGRAFLVTHFQHLFLTTYASDNYAKGSCESGSQKLIPAVICAPCNDS